MALGRGVGHKVQPAGMHTYPLRSGTPQSKVFKAARGPGPTQGTIASQVPHWPPDSYPCSDLAPSHGQAPSCPWMPCSHGSSLTQGRLPWFKALCSGYSRPPQPQSRGAERVVVLLKIAMITINVPSYLPVAVPRTSCAETCGLLPGHQDSQVGKLRQTPTHAAQGMASQALMDGMRLCGFVQKVNPLLTILTNTVSLVEDCMEKRSPNSKQVLTKLNVIHLRMSYRHFNGGVSGSVGPAGGRPAPCPSDPTSQAPAPPTCSLPSPPPPQGAFIRKKIHEFFSSFRYILVRANLP